MQNNQINDSNILKWLVKFSKPYIYWLMIAFVAMVVVAYFELLIPLKLKEIVDSIVSGIATKSQIKETSIKVFFFILGVFLFSSLFSYILNISGQKIMKEIRDEIFNHVLKLPQSFFDQQSVGRITTRVTNDVNALNEFYTNVLVQFLKDFLVIVGVMYVMFTFNYDLSLIIICITFVIIFFAFLYRKRLRRVYTKLRLTISQLNSFISESVRGIALIKLYNKSDDNFSRFEKLSNENYQANLDQMYTFAIFRPFIEFMSVFSTAVIVWFGGREVLSGNLSLGELLAVLFFLRMIFRPILDLADKYNILQSALAASENIYKIISIEKDKFGNKKFDSNFKKISFKNIFFAYKDEDWVLKDFNLEIDNGDSILLLGSTGSGKTTILNLLLGFYKPQKGEILIDGVNLNEFDIDSIRDNFSVVMQDTPLFNITPDEQDSNNNFQVKSVGEKQIKNIEYMLEKPFHIIILDEATSNLDLDLEKNVKSYLNSIKAKTSLVIAHRLNLIRDKDKIIVLKDGRLIESGTHSELINNENEYSKIFAFNKQFYLS